MIFLALGNLLAALLAYVMTRKTAATASIAPTVTLPATPAVTSYIPKSKQDFVSAMQTALSGCDFSSLVGESKATTQNCIIAVASFESAWAGLQSKGIYTKTNNLFSITKGSTWTGPVYTTASGMKFRIYSTWRESIMDFIKHMDTPYYRDAKSAILKGDGKLFFQTLKRLGYDATDPLYAEHLVDTLNVVASLT